MLEPLPLPDKIWTSISMNFIIGLPKSLGKDSILVVINRLSKYSQFLAKRTLSSHGWATTKKQNIHVNSGDPLKRDGVEVCLQ